MQEKLDDTSERCCASLGTRKITTVDSDWDWNSCRYKRAFSLNDSRYKRSGQRSWHTYNPYSTTL